MTPLETPTTEPASTAPWWLQPVYAFGIPSAIAVFLVWFLTAVVVAGQNKLQDTMDDHVKAQQRQVFLLSLICRNTAQTERERAQCEVTP